MAGHDALVTAIHRATAEKNGRLGEGVGGGPRTTRMGRFCGGEGRAARSSGVAACGEPFVGLAGVFSRLTEMLIAGKYVD